MSMFCNQCEQTARGEGCTTVGVCGKKEDVAALQDLLVQACRGISLVAVDAEKLGVDVAVEGAFLADALFTTLTNVDFDATSVAHKVDQAVTLRDALKARVALAGGRNPHQARIHCVLDVTFEDAVFYEHVALAGIAFVVDVQ